MRVLRECKCIRLHPQPASATAVAVRCALCVVFAANLCVNKHESRCINAHTKANSAESLPTDPLSLFPANKDLNIPAGRDGTDRDAEAGKLDRELLNAKISHSSSGVKFMWHATKYTDTQSRHAALVGGSKWVPENEIQDTKLHLPPLCVYLHFSLPSY